MYSNIDRRKKEATENSEEYIYTSAMKYITNTDNIAKIKISITGEKLFYFAWSVKSVLNENRNLYFS
jgi:hypothetical protein